MEVQGSPITAPIARGCASIQHFPRGVVVLTQHIVTFTQVSPCTFPAVLPLPAGSHAPATHACLLVVHASTQAHLHDTCCYRYSAMCSMFVAAGKPIPTTRTPPILIGNGFTAFAPAHCSQVWHPAPAHAAQQMSHAHVLSGTFACASSRDPWGLQGQRAAAMWGSGAGRSGGGGGCRCASCCRYDALLMQYSDVRADVLGERLTNFRK